MFVLSPPQTIYFTQIYTRVLISGKTNKQKTLNLRHGKKFIRKNLLFFSPSMKLVDIFFPTKCFISFSVTYDKYILSYILHLYSTENVSFEIFFPC